MPEGAGDLPRQQRQPGHEGDQDAAEWLPPRREAWCGFATDWITVKIRWNLTADQAETAALHTALDTCDDSTPPPANPPTSASLTVIALDCPGEAVTGRNDGSQTADLTGWTVHDQGKLHTFPFPSGYQLAAGATVTIRSGGAAGPGELHWMNAPVWNNTGDTAHLVDPSGGTRSTRSC